MAKKCCCKWKKKGKICSSCPAKEVVKSYLENTDKTSSTKKKDNKDLKSKVEDKKGKSKKDKKGKGKKSEKKKGGKKSKK